MFRKPITEGIILLFLLSSLIPIVSSDTPTLNKTIYVDDDGGADYTRIQDAIDNASDGDTVFVYNGVYYENVVVNKTLTLIGENKNTTIIDGGKHLDVVLIEADYVDISGFTIRNSGTTGNPKWYSGIRILSSENSIHNNIVINNRLGIYVRYSSYNNVLNNIVILNSDAIVIDTSVADEPNNNIMWNSIYNNTYVGITCHGSINNNIIGNDIFDNGRDGIFLTFHSDYNTIRLNNIFNQGNGIYVFHSKYTTIIANNIYNNLWRGIRNSVYSHYSNISGNNITNCTVGIRLDNSNYHYVSGNNISYNTDSGIFIWSPKRNTITRNNISNNNNGIYLRSADENTINKNIISNNNYGIRIRSSSINQVSYNQINHNLKDGIIFYSNSNNNSLEGNNINDNNDGIYLDESPNNNITGNNINDNTNYSTYLYNSSGTNIRENNYIGNGLTASFNNSRKTSWQRNYWDDLKWYKIKIIRGDLEINLFNSSFSFIWFNFDWNPAKEPYDIP